MSLKHLCRGCFAKKGHVDECPYCGFSESKYIVPPYSLSLGRILNNRYVIGKVLGSGGFGITYIAYDAKLEYAVAIKEYLPKELALRDTDSVSVSPISESYTEDFLHFKEAFIKEAKILAKFNNESGIVSVQDIFLENGTVYIVMYYIKGVTLEEYLANNGNKLPPKKVVQIMKVIMRSLKRVHGEGVIHRDISPDNIYITPDNEVKLLDFGAARYFIGNNKNTLSVVLKRGYAPLEQYHNKIDNQGPWTDIYSIAATMYRAITGVKPPDSLDRITEDDLKSPSELGIQMPSNIEAAIMKALSVRYTHRQRSLDEFIKQLEPMEKTETIREDSLKNINEKYNNIKIKALGLISLAIIILSISIISSLVNNGNAELNNDTLNSAVTANEDTENSLNALNDTLDASETPSVIDEPSGDYQDYLSPYGDDYNASLEPVVSNTPETTPENIDNADPEGSIEIQPVDQETQDEIGGSDETEPALIDEPEESKEPEPTGAHKYDPIPTGIEIISDATEKTQTISMYKELLPEELPEIINICIICTNTGDRDTIISLAKEDFKYSFTYNGRSGEYYRFKDNGTDFVILLLYNEYKELLGYYSYKNPL